MVNRRDLELFRVGAAGEVRHRLQSAGRIGNVEQMIPMLCSSTLLIDQYGGSPFVIDGDWSLREDEDGARIPGDISSIVKACPEVKSKDTRNAGTSTCVNVQLYQDQHPYHLQSPSRKYGDKTHLVSVRDMKSRDG